MKRDLEKELRSSRWDRDYWEQKYEQLKVEAERLTKERDETREALRRAEDGDMAQCLANYRAIRRAALASEGKTEAERLPEHASAWKRRAEAAEAEIVKLRQLWRKRDHIANEWADRARRAAAALAKAREALERIAETDVIYPPHDPGNYFAPEGREGPCAKIARAAFAPEGKTEAELRHDCAASGRHDHDGCDCSAEELARRAALAPEGKPIS